MEIYRNLNDIIRIKKINFHVTFTVTCRSRTFGTQADKSLLNTSHKKEYKNPNPLVVRYVNQMSVASEFMIIRGFLSVKVHCRSESKENIVGNVSQ